MEDEFQYKGVKQAPFALLMDSTTFIIPSKENKTHF